MGKKRTTANDLQKNRRALVKPPKENPFEKRKIKKKRTVLGQQLKSEESLGQTRAQAIEQRKKTLLVDFQQQGKKNIFIDKRIGEKDETLTQEEKMLIRYQKEQQKKILKRSLFSLDDQEDSLTHFGQSLSEIDNFDDYMVE